MIWHLLSPNLKNNYIWSMIFTIKNIFRLIAILEGLSYILLLIATPIKYLFGNEQYVKALGMPHGILFILYIFFAILIQKKWIGTIKI